MRILLDECVNPRIREALPDDQVITVAAANWRALPDHQLIAAARGRIEVLVTIDRGFEFEHNLAELTFGIVIIHVPRNRMDCYRPLFSDILAAVQTVRAGAVVHVRGAT